jgi:hypothetical protein
MSKSAEDTEETDFMAVLEKGVRDVLGNRKASPTDKLAAVNAGAKLLAIKHKITGGDEDSFFK